MTKSFRIRFLCVCGAISVAYHIGTFGSEKQASENVGDRSSCTGQCAEYKTWIDGINSFEAEVSLSIEKIDNGAATRAEGGAMFCGEKKTQQALADINNERIYAAVQKLWDEPKFSKLDNTPRTMMAAGESAKSMVHGYAVGYAEGLRFSAEILSAEKNKATYRAVVCGAMKSLADTALKQNGMSP